MGEAVIEAEELGIARRRCTDATLASRPGRGGGVGKVGEVGESDVEGGPTAALDGTKRTQTTNVIRAVARRGRTARRDDSLTGPSEARGQV